MVTYGILVMLLRPGLPIALYSDLVGSGQALEGGDSKIEAECGQAGLNSCGARIHAGLNSSRFWFPLYARRSSVRVLMDSVG